MIKRARLFLFYACMAVTSLVAPRLGIEMINHAERGAKEKK